ncbi:lasso RiPP family leader peptide-containing protein [Thermobifida alba]|uniref:Lasso RiPP family leader peptide-containing protein n=1 Tax=Thermobifida alba TaxID=53522 RepID=A0ABY4L7Y3_THEAE|nr:lasso RiPP family leader peptide-containing protein [Thermobifida alba]HLU96157.1 lasso RiPP family leader peptide-containing protein [Thermobifida alba]
MDEEIYQPPELVELGDAREVTLGAADDDTADMNTAKYY